MRDLLKTLCQLPGVSGHEDAVRDFISAKCESFADDIKVDKLGNLMVYRKGTNAEAPTLMLCAHMDEVGLIVSSITDEGMLKFVGVGGLDRRVLLGQRVLVGKQQRPALIGLRAVHLSDEEERAKIPKMEDLYIDAGFANKAEAETEVSLGDFITFDTVQCEFGNGMFKAKAIDDRVGCAALLKVMENRYPNPIWYVFTVQEEIGTRGAFGATFQIKPHFAIVVEGTTAADLPSLSGHRQVCRPGGGVVVPYMDGGALYDRGLFSALRTSAERCGYAWQTKEYVSGGTDASAIQRTQAGFRVAGIALAVRYIHSPSCVIKMEEAEQMVDVLQKFLSELHV